MPKQNQIADFRKMKVEDLVKTGEEKRAELFALKFQAVLGSLEQTHRIKQIKKEIARIELVLTEFKNQGQDINKSVKTDYSKAVEQADQEGKKVREKQLKEIEKLTKTATNEVEEQPITDKDEEVKEPSVNEDEEPKAKPAPKAKKGATTNGKK